MPTPKTIDTLVEDVVRAMGPDHTPITDEALAKYGAAVARHARDTLSKRTVRARPNPKTIYASEIGDSCPTRLWHKRHGTVGLPIDGTTELKFLVGDFYEETLLMFAEASGHDVTNRQAEVTFDAGAVHPEYEGWFVTGHIDAVIDGAVVDVKSSSSYAYELYTRDGLVTTKNNSFGYVEQLNFYAWSMDMDGWFWVVDKTTGQHSLVDVEVISIRDRIWDRIKEQRSLDDYVTVWGHPPEAHYQPEPFGKKGNMKLGTQCSYCPFKLKCFPQVRAFKYSKGKIEYLTEVKDTPSVEEVSLEV